jgi:hypothetical protein
LIYVVFIAAIPAPVKTFPHGNQWHGRVTELAILKAVVAEGTSALMPLGRCPELAILKMFAS